MAPTESSMHGRAGVLNTLLEVEKTLPNTEIAEAARRLYDVVYNEKVGVTYLGGFSGLPLPLDVVVVAIFLTALLKLCNIFVPADWTWIAAQLHGFAEATQPSGTLLFLPTETFFWTLVISVGLVVAYRVTWNWLHPERPISLRKWNLMGIPVGYAKETPKKVREAAEALGKAAAKHDPKYETSVFKCMGD